MQLTTSTDDARYLTLRRADWRFLGWTPAPDVSVTYADGPLTAAVAAVSGRTVDGRAQPLHEDADLAVAVDPDADTLRAAWRALRPGGSCYTEWTSRSACLAGGVRGRLEAAGFSGVALYLARPWAADRSPGAWIPVGNGCAARWCADLVHRDSGVRAALGRAVRRAAWRMAAVVPTATPVLALARKRPAGRTAPRAQDDDFEDVRRRAVRAARARRSPALGSAPDTTWVLFTPGTNVLNKAIFLALDADGRPECAIKLPRTAEAADGIRREAAALEEIHALDGDLPGIPRVLLSGSCGDVPYVAESAVEGVPVSRLVRGDLDAIAMSAADWLARLVRRDQRLSASGRARLIEPVLDYLDAEIGAIADPALVRATRAALGTLPALPIASEQRDFAPWNMFATAGGDLAVLDWESAEPRGLPALDLIYFLTYATVYREQARDQQRILDAHRATLAPTTAAGDVTRRCLSRYAAKSGIDPRAIGPLRMLCWLLHSRCQYQRLTRERGAPPSRAELRDSLFVALWEQEVRAASRWAA